ncbi:unnamed protein product [Miscanthus lutarioriparius]|uniref:Uncharacterized protein n=1 Tax=Miscanthus lutarioriparius TaxID=422564 RepID=A0A811NCK6_9POAL|nr:unnamed protein product [Miscanthus lutarioriparius]
MAAAVQQALAGAWVQEWVEVGMGGTTTRLRSLSSSHPSWTTPPRPDAWFGGAEDSRRAGGALPRPQRVPLPRPSPNKTGCCSHPEVPFGHR